MAHFRRTLPAFILLSGLLGAQQTVAGNAKAPDVPEWQRAAGGKMAFEVASIRPSEPGTFSLPNFPLSNDDSFKNVHGLLSADFPLTVYIEFAYKIFLSPEEREVMMAGLPKWVDDQSFTIRARAPGDPTKDQMRLMMQALLADRFKLAAHFETRVLPALILTLDKPGKTGPNLRPHAEGPACDAPIPVAMKGASGTVPKVFPAECDVQAMYGQPDHKVLTGSRNATMSVVAASLSPLGRLGRPVVDQTGLTGRFDYRLLFTPEEDAPAGPEVGSQGDGGTSFLEALKEQLGLKLTRSKAPISVLVIDHVEVPSAN
jgi:bla regulator protein blaR1